MNKQIDNTGLCIGDIVVMKGVDSNRVMRIKSVVMDTIYSENKTLVALDIFEYRNGIFINTITSGLENWRYTNLLIKDTSMTRKFKIYCSMNEI